jgi:hypothetical protein
MRKKSAPPVAQIPEPDVAKKQHIEGSEPGSFAEPVWAITASRSHRKLKTEMALSRSGRARYKSTILDFQNTDFHLFSGSEDKNRGLY